MHNSVATVKKEWNETKEKMSENQRELAEFFGIDDLFSISEDRIKDVELIVNGLQDEIRGLQGLATVTSERQMRKIYETLQENTRSTDEMIRSSQKTSGAISFLQWIISGSIALSVVTFLRGQSPFSSLDPIFILLKLPTPSQLFPYSTLTLWGLGLIVWVVITLSLYYVANFLKSRSVKSVRLRIKLDTLFAEDKLTEYLSTKSLSKHDDHFDYDQQLHKKTWTDKNEKWKGGYPRITLTYDKTNDMLSQIQVEVDKPKLKSGSYVNLIMDELIDAEILGKDAKKSIKIE
jgi:hypothetical protein